MRGVFFVFAVTLLIYSGCKSQYIRELKVGERVIYCRPRKPCLDTKIFAIDDKANQVGVYTEDGSKHVEPNLLLPVTLTDKNTINDRGVVFVRCRGNYKGLSWPHWIQTQAEKLPDGNIKLRQNDIVEWPDGNRPSREQMEGFWKDCGINLTNYDFNPLYTVVITPEQYKRMNEELKKLENGGQ
jgi:hypothetical protein